MAAKKDPQPGPVVVHEAELTPIDRLTPHPRNYQSHPDDQIEHLRTRLREHGFYRNVIAARDGTILAGHGIVEAARREGLDVLPVVVIDLDPDDPRAIKILVGDNEVTNLAETDDRRLSELLREVTTLGVDGLAGTGFDEAMFANLVLVTRHEHEIADLDRAAEWAGLPAFEQANDDVRIVIHFDNIEDRTKLCEQLGLTISHKNRLVWAGWWPPRTRQDFGHLKFDTDSAEDRLDEAETGVDA